MKKKYVVILTLVLAVLASAGGYWYYQFEYRATHQPKPETEVIETNTDATIYKLDELIAKLEEFDVWFDKDDLQKMKAEKEYGTYIIPGLKTTKTLQTDNLQMVACTSMTPQGLAVTEEYLFISAYCHTKEHNSVIYMLDRNSHEFIKEIVLSDQSHVGGLAYDPDNMMLWVSGHENETAFANAFSMQSILEHNVDQTKTPLFYSQRVPLYTLKRNSFMTYNDNQLFAGFFNKKKNGTLQKYELEENGTLKTAYGEENVKQKKFTISSKQALPAQLGKVSSKVQGIAFTGEYLLMSQSYGVTKSVLRVFDKDAIGDDGYHFTDENALISFELPDKLEQIYVYDDKIFLLFESAAYAYRARPMTNVDRVVSVDLLDEIAKAEKEEQEEEAPLEEEPEEELTIDEYLDEDTDEEEDIQEDTEPDVPENEE